MRADGQLSSTIPSGTRSRLRRAEVAPQKRLVAVGSDADEGGFFREERELDECGAGCCAWFGHDDPGSVTRIGLEEQENRGFGMNFGGGAAGVLQYYL